MYLDLDQSATLRRIEEIAATGLRTLEQCVERSEEFDREIQDTIVKQDEHLKAGAEEIAAAEVAREAAEAEAAAAAPPVWAARPSKPTVLSIGDDLEDAAPPPRPMFAAPPVPQVAPQVPEPVVRPSTERYLSFGTEHDDIPETSAEPVQLPPRPAPRRGGPAEPEEDDDWSGHSWVR